VRPVFAFGSCACVKDTMKTILKNKIWKYALLFIGVFCISQAGGWTSVNAYTWRWSTASTSNNTVVATTNSNVLNSKIVFFPVLNNTANGTVYTLSSYTKDASALTPGDYYFVFGDSNVQGNINSGGSMGWVDWEPWQSGNFSSFYGGGTITIASSAVVGCMDSGANNYNPLATEDETPSLCTYDLGCMKPHADNFDPYAVEDDVPSLCQFTTTELQFDAENKIDLVSDMTLCIVGESGLEDSGTTGDNRGITTFWSATKWCSPYMANYCDIQEVAPPSSNVPYRFIFGIQDCADPYEWDYSEPFYYAMNIYEDTRDIVYGSVPYSGGTIGITNTTPANNATGVNAYTHFTGTYSNDGSYDTVGISYTNLDATNSPVVLKICDIAETGENLEYSCHGSLSTDTHYAFLPFLWDSQQTYPAGVVVDSEGLYYFTTGQVYETQTPATSSTCGTLEIGCYIENAISWSFSISQETLNKFGDLTLANSVPFSYLYDMGDLYNELFDQEAEAIDFSIPFGNGEITLLSTEKLEAIPFQPLVRTILGAIMIFLTTMFLYRQVIGIHDHEHEIVVTK